jgi:prepilin-type N-terminal cleavage/methylation domain-containing protein
MNPDVEFVRDAELGRQLRLLHEAKLAHGIDWMLHSSWCSDGPAVIALVRHKGDKALGQPVKDSTVEETVRKALALAMKNNKGFTLIELLVVIAIISIIATIVGGAGLITSCGGCGSVYSDGHRAGVVTKLSRKGYVNKSWEGELALGGASADSNGLAVARTWSFSITDEDVAKKVQEALDNGKRVSLHYDQYAVKPITIDTPYVVNDLVYPK